MGEILENQGNLSVRKSRNHETGPSKLNLRFVHTEPLRNWALLTFMELFAFSNPYRHNILSQNVTHTSSGALRSNYRSDGECIFHTSRQIL